MPDCKVLPHGGNNELLNLKGKRVLCDQLQFRFTNWGITYLLRCLCAAATLEIPLGGSIKDFLIILSLKDLPWSFESTGGRQREMNVGWEEWLGEENMVPTEGGRSRGRWGGTLWFLTTSLKRHCLSSDCRAVSLAASQLLFYCLRVLGRSRDNQCPLPTPYTPSPLFYLVLIIDWIWRIFLRLPTESISSPGRRFWLHQGPKPQTLPPVAGKPLQWFVCCQSALKTVTWRERKRERERPWLGERGKKEKVGVEE